MTRVRFRRRVVDALNAFDVRAEVGLVRLHELAKLPALDDELTDAVAQRVTLAAAGLAVLRRGQTVRPQRRFDVAV